jgi:hypothetical protein
VGIRKFSTRLLNVTAEGALLREPLSFQGRISEQRLEDFVVAEPELAGEPLLILGRQLREFEEDVDRLDVLALDEDGEIVLLELKVTDDFRVTDLQALAYAAAYANQDNEHFARALQKWLVRCGDATASLGTAKQLICDFLGVQTFDAWEPSQHVRIKLIAPGFPKRVLSTVKWLGDLYGMRIEAIQVRLFETSAESYQLAFDRLLPIPQAEEFDLTVRQREERRRRVNVQQSRRPDVVWFLAEHGHLQDGQALWLKPGVLPPTLRAAYDEDAPLYKVNFTLENGSAKFAWRQSPDAALQLLSPSTVVYHVVKALDPTSEPHRYRAVHDKFTVAPGGQTLGELAEEHGWTGE